MINGINFNYLNKFGRLCYGIALAGLGLLTIHDHDFPYMLIPPGHSWIPHLATLLCGIFFTIAGTALIVEKKARPMALFLGIFLTLVFCGYFIPYQWMMSSNGMNILDWDNAGKELALAGGAWVIAGCYPEKKDKVLTFFLAKLIPLGMTLFTLAMIFFGALHLRYAKEVSGYVPSWVYGRLFWTYLAGAGLISSGLAILLNILRRLAGILLGSMIFTWFMILHLPRVIVAPVAEIGSELTSALIALAYSGIAFIIAGLTGNTRQSKRVQNDRR